MSICFRVAFTSTRSSGFQYHQVVVVSIDYHAGNNRIDRGQ